MDRWKISHCLTALEAAGVIHRAGRTGRKIKYKIDYEWTPTVKAAASGTLPKPPHPAQLAPPKCAASGTVTPVPEPGIFEVAPSIGVSSSVGTTSVGISPEKDGGPGEGTKTRRGTRLPADFEPGEAERRLAAELGLDLLAVLAEFRDYWAAIPGAKGVKLDWAATLRNWLRREAKRAGSWGSGPADGRGTVGQLGVPGYNPVAIYS